MDYSRPCKDTLMAEQSSAQCSEGSWEWQWRRDCPQQYELVDSVSVPSIPGDTLAKVSPGIDVLTLFDKLVLLWSSRRVPSHSQEPSETGSAHVHH